MMWCTRLCDILPALILKFNPADVQKTNKPGTLSSTRALMTSWRIVDGAYQSRALHVMVFSLCHWDILFIQLVQMTFDSVYVCVLVCACVSVSFFIDERDGCLWVVYCLSWWKSNDPCSKMRTLQQQLHQGVAWGNTLYCKDYLA